MRIPNNKRFVALGVLGVLFIAYAISVGVPNLRERSEILQLSKALRSLSLERIETAVRAFTRDHPTTNGVAASAIALEELISAGYLPVDDAKAFGNASVTVFPVANASNPQMILAAARTPRGREVVLLCDGSVQQVSAARYRGQVATQVQSRQPTSRGTE